jgi:hypothetical protein
MKGRRSRQDQEARGFPWFVSAVWHSKGDRVDSDLAPGDVQLGRSLVKIILSG